MKCKDCEFCEEQSSKDRGYCNLQLPRWMPVLTINGVEPNRSVYLGEFGGDECDLGQKKKSLTES